MTKPTRNCRYCGTPCGVCGVKTHERKCLRHYNLDRKNWLKFINQCRTRRGLPKLTETPVFANGVE
jgi:hypothetical protein